MKNEIVIKVKYILGEKKYFVSINGFRSSERYNTKKEALIQGLKSALDIIKRR